MSPSAGRVLIWIRPGSCNYACPVLEDRKGSALPFESGISAYDPARNGTITLNTLYNISSNGNPSYPNNCWRSDGIYVDGGTNIVVERNLIDNVDLGIDVTSEHSGRTASCSTGSISLLELPNTAKNIFGSE
jgi:hypothetical protein